MLTHTERAGLRAYLQALPESPAFRSPCLPAPAPKPSDFHAMATTAEQVVPVVVARAEPGDQPSPDESAPALAEALTGLKVLLDLARSLPLPRSGAVLVERVGKTSRRLETQLERLRSA